MKKKTKINVLHKNQMYINYKIEEIIIISIVMDNLKFKNNEEQLNIVFYY